MATNEEAISIEPFANLILTFVDGEGQEWLAAAAMGNLIRYGEAEGDVIERIPAEGLKDRDFTLTGMKLVHRDGD